MEHAPMLSKALRAVRGSSLSASRGSRNVPDEEAAIVERGCDVVVLVARPSPHAYVRVGTHIHSQKALVFREGQSAVRCKQSSYVPNPTSVSRRR